MGTKKRMQLSFGNTQEDEEIYNYLKYGVTNASALVRMLVKCYMEGRAIGGTMPTMIQQPQMPQQYYIPQMPPVEPQTPPVEQKAEQEQKVTKPSKRLKVGGSALGKTLRNKENAFGVK